MRHLPTLTVLGCLLLPQPAFAGGEKGLTFEEHVRPILKAHCFECHGEGPKLRGGLDLRLRRLIVAGGNNGAAVEPGRRDDSWLYERVATGVMPPGKKKLSAAEVDLIGRWIAEGARTSGPEPDNLTAGLHVTEAERSFWSFQPVRRPSIPGVRQAGAVRTPVDAFLLQRLEAKGLSFAPEADRRALIRRATFDLLGLPPTPEEVERFAADPSPDAYERLIDRLLDTPAYGERWGRHWLDVAGYADSDGGSADDPVRNYAYKYRDYVIRAFNNDKPWDQFIREQLAGDELVKPPYANLAPEAVDQLTATGFLRMAPDGTGSAGADQPVARNQVVADTLKIVSTSLLGLTVACAQCHNHRYDPIPQTDYYRLRAVLEPALNWKDWRTPRQRLVSLYTDADKARAARVEAEAVKIDQERLKKQAEYIEQTLEKELARLPEALREPLRQARATPAGKQTPEQKQLLKEHPSVLVSPGSLYLYNQKMADDLKSYADRAAAVRAAKPAEEFVHALTEVPGRVPPTFLFHRGDHEQAKQTVEPGGLTILEGTAPLQIPTGAGQPTSGRRLAMARWLTDGRHPLTARVLINRVWMHHFGKGIVNTPGDFGLLGERPTHPELLDWLADDFTAGGWRLKRMHKLLMTSAAYRQSSRRDPDKDTADPDNRLLGRMPVRRLEAEVLRDALLAVSGQLNRAPFGPPVPVRVDTVGQVVVGVDTDDTAGRPTGKVVSLHGAEFRRSVYVQARRSKPLAVLEAFDAPVPEPNCEMRNFSTVAPQSLLLMNNEFVLAAAEAFAARLRAEAGPNPEAQVRHAWRLAYARNPGETELREALAFLTEQTRYFQGKSAGTKSDPGRQALASLGQALLNANGFLYID